MLLGILVVAAGLGIGVLSAVVMHRGSTPAALETPFPAPTPVIPTEPPAPTEAPPPSETPVPPPSPTPAATRAPTPSPVSKPTASAAAVPGATATVPPTPRPLRAAAPAAAAPSASLSSVVPAAPTLRPTLVPPAATAAPLATGSAFDFETARSVVNRYLRAVGSGDDATARTLLGASPGDATVPLPELSIVGPDSRIVSIGGRRTGAASAAVNVQIESGGTTYLIVYEVREGPNGTYIAGRDITRQGQSTGSP